MNLSKMNLSKKFLGLGLAILLMLPLVSIPIQNIPSATAAGSAVGTIFYQFNLRSGERCHLPSAFNSR